MFAIPSCGGGSSGGDSPGDVIPGDPIEFATTFNTGLAIGADLEDAAVVGHTIVVAVTELDMTEDRNGDGDTVDRVVTAVDTETGAFTDLGLAIIGPIISTDKTVAFLVSEGQHRNQDLNGDGDTADALWFIYDPRRPLDKNNPINTGVATTSSGAPGIATDGGYVLMRAEAADSVDRNGDGDASDLVATVWKDQFGAIVPVPVTTYAVGRPLVARAGRVLIPVSEAAAASDLNRDGDAFDTVLVYADLTGLTVLIRPTGGVFPRSVANHPYTLTADAAVYMIDEASEGAADLNGDGDATDAVVAVFDIAGGTGEHRPVSARVASPGLAVDPTRGFGASDHRVVFTVSERDQGGIDLNGDLDLVDSVVSWTDTKNGPNAAYILPFALGLLPIRVDGERALVGVNEQADGAIVGKDQNGDGDVNDNVAFMLDMPHPRGEMFNLNFAVTTLELSGTDALIGVPENGHFNGDLNGNGKVEDIVTFYFDFSDTPPSMRSLGLIASATSMFRLSSIEVRLAALVPEGQSNQLRDLNKDGDQRDNAVLLVGIDPSGPSPFVAPPTPFFAGTGAFATSPPRRIGVQVFAFATSEDMMRLDLNGDGDTLDTVLQFVRYD